MSNDNKNIQATLTVTRKTLITPNYMRVYLTGEEVARIANTTVGVNNKILIPPAGLNKINYPDFDYEKMQWIQPPMEVRPTIRTYTHRGVDLDKQEIWIDFALHGDNGPASAWAINAETGNVLGVLMHDEKSELFPVVDNYVLVADASGIPVIGAILEALPSNASGICLLEVHDEADRQELTTAADIQFTWLFNEHPAEGSQLSSVLKQQTLPVTSRFGYVAAEFDTVKNIRNYLRKDNNWNRQELYAYSYWKAGVAEDKSTMERHLEKDSIA